MQDEAVGAAERMRDAVFCDLRGRMQRIDESRRETVEVNRTAGVAHVDLFHALCAEPGRKIGVRQHGRTGFTGDLDRVADMVSMAMGEQDVGEACHGILAGRFVEGRIAGEERVDEDSCLGGLDPEGRMAEPGDLHVYSPVSIRWGL